MWNKEQKEAWEGLENLWNEQPESEKINIQIENLVLELKNKTSEFEKKSIQKDLDYIKENTSDFEKDSIKKDLKQITSFLAKFKSKKKKK
ncbi:hypothetical protein [Aureivirga marina]|uniref:hypothetical protein n=1 Tax=Aureivirga marina TaxID=1182451 RepID=UPI0018C9B5A7|nr:hypothetical protein [Aureivirga marina]